MNYHNITHDDQNNGDGLRVVLWVSGCEHYCKGCQNEQTWDVNSGIKFDVNAMCEIIEQLKEQHISGITFSGGDPLHENNYKDIYVIIRLIKMLYPDKTIWLYTGYNFEEIMDTLNPRKFVAKLCDVIVDGEYIENLNDTSLYWRGSSNQRVIDVKKSVETGKVVELYE